MNGAQRVNTHNIATQEYDAVATFQASSAPAFILPASTDLWLPNLTFNTRFAEFMAFQVSRRPNDLHNHVRRVIYHYKYGEQTTLFAALIDLFIALGQCGWALRRRMLTGAQPQLSMAHYQYLSDYLDCGLCASDLLLPATTGSRLTRGLIGTPVLISGSADAAAARNDPLAEAKDYLAYGDAANAQRVLEQAVIKTPEQLELHYELLEIYSHTRDQQSFVRTAKRIPQDQNPVWEVWDAVGNFLFGTVWPSILNQDPLSEAQSFLEYSQIDAARDVLVRALCADPTRLELHHELMGIFHTTRDAIGIRSLLLQLDTKKIPLVKEWEQLAASLEA